MSSIVKRKGLLVATAVTMGLVLSACGGGDSSDGGGGDQPAAEGSVELNMLIASSGDAETQAVQDAVKAWGDESGNTVKVTVASDMGQELAQGFASDSPADVFYMDASLFADYAQNGSLYSYGDQVDEPDDFYQALRDTFTYDDQLVCAPKDFSTLALEINTDAWEKAGLTDADIPTDWDQLATVAEKLTTGDQVGLGLSHRHRPARRLRRRQRRLVAQRRQHRGDGQRPRRGRRADLRPGQPQEGRASPSPASSTRGGVARRSARARPR